MSVGARMLVDVEHDAQTTTGNVVQLGTVDEDIAIRKIINWCETALCLRAGSIVEVADEGYHEQVFYLVNRNVHNLIFYFLTFLLFTFLLF